MVARNCLSLAVDTIVSGEELCEFFYHATKYCNQNDRNKWREICYYLRRDEENGWLDPKATYIVERRERDSGCGADTRIWFRRIQEEK